MRQARPHPSLYQLFHDIAAAPTAVALRSRFMDQASEIFGVQRWGIYLLDESQQLASADAVGVSDDFIDQYQKFGQSVDPMLQYVIQYHAPTHEELVLPLGGWKQCELYQRCCSQYDHEHVMTGAIVGQGELIGTINFARVGITPAFNQLDLAKLSAVTTHFSARLAELRRQEMYRPNPFLRKLTAREQQIAELVAKGLTNAEIGKELWITQNSVKQALKRMFRKLVVTARTEMVAKLREMD
jgi:DNA-binding CsgD family transcriptional regulator